MLAGELERSHPGAAALREGMAETLTLTRLGISGPFTRTLASTNPIESMIECVRRTSRNVKRWQSGEMALRWTAVGMLEAERQFRRIIGYQQLATLALAIERELASSMTTEEVATPPSLHSYRKGPLSKFYDERDILKEGAAPTYKRGFGFHPMLCYLDATGEALAGVLSPGNARANSAADHIGVLVDALDQLPSEVREDEATPILVRTDSAGATHAFLEAVVEMECSFSVLLSFPWVSYVRDRPGRGGQRPSRVSIARAISALAFVNP